MNIDEELQKASSAMDDVEDALMKTGFSKEQWELISKYISSAIIHSQWAFAKSCQNLPKIDITS